MKPLTFSIILAVAFACLYVGALDVAKLSPVHQALYGAMKAGWIIGHVGGTEEEFETIFLKVNAGDTNAITKWLDSKLPKKNSEPKTKP